ncbi:MULTISPECIES: flagellar biosynthesis anti-sigma factor FlgM [unclassified Rhodanobacter]|jgi:negative regulator of flagellin synthesis FlgM|uniref:flagellar biosynthesis anti-sigma factor FlgM n=1 Tax=unclassified Rhodanobacter TaxID=2621553 RepID=UPI00161EC377|nr:MULTISPECIES: flagellar biosynthesis anti-sigma factor FlgM [unclassified Rhodanobacter]MBB6240861.1 negative regulator of flagellin synthesis FlgM [Rhodanobacter sp. MP1X3]MBB6247300.1 negative regulator of flagellin synthesis FlgM [Rhodanobacter sp. A1T4]
MNTTISPNGLPALPQTKTNQGSAGSQTSTTSASGSASPQADDSVKLTDSARALHQASSVNAQSPVDTAKVEQIRKSLADGNYRVDASNIADRLTSIESQINGTS